MVVVVVEERRNGSVHHALIGGISGGISSGKDALRRKREQQRKHRSRHEDSGESKLKRHGSTAASAHERNTYEWSGGVSELIRLWA